MSSRQPEELDRLFKRVPNVGLIAENGCFLKEFGHASWKEMPNPEKMRAWKESVEGIMTYYQERTPGSWIETRHCSLIFHYKNAEDFESASRQAGDCASHINDACEKQRVRAIPIDGMFNSKQARSETDMNQEPWLSSRSIGRRQLPQRKSMRASRR
jgi:trehalose-phosphatase